MAAKQPYPFTAISSTPLSSNNPYRRQNTMNPVLQQPRQQPYSTRTPPGSTTALLHPQLQAGPSSRPNVQAAFARGPAPAKASEAYQESRFANSAQSLLSNHSASEKFNLSPDPSFFLKPNERESDDYLHNPDPRRDRKNDKGGTIFTTRGFANLGCLVFLCLALVALFAGYPMATYFSKHSLNFFGAFNLGGTNATGQVPHFTHGRFTLIDPDTPKDAYTIKSLKGGDTFDLVFSDEFNTPNRTFWPGDDPFWEAVDLHYWATNNLEWYSPYAITTADGALKITLSQKENHNLDFQGGMLQSWNKFCFTGGMILTSVQLPGINNVLGLWPAIWTLGNLGRAGYGATLEGMWPYTYDACDVGAAPNQTVGGQPLAATFGNDRGHGGALSWLQGQKLSRCTCPGEVHPGPIHAEDGSFVGRAAPEIDIFEAQVDQTTFVGGVSQSGQWAPFNLHYQWFNESNLIIPNPSISSLNSYTGGALQQATSVVTAVNTSNYQLTQQGFGQYGIEYKPGYDDGYITWIANNVEAWTLLAPGMGADPRVNISARPVPQEPMYIIMNLGMSRNFGPVDLDHLTFPAIMSVDWVRVYQPPDQKNVGCDPENFPTTSYINQFIDAYTNPNLTTWRDDFKQPFPKNKLLEPCN